MSSRKRKDRHRKRKFYGNRYTPSLCSNAEVADLCDNHDTPVEAEITVESASRSKIGTPSNKINVENIEGYRFIDAELLISFLCKFPCKTFLQQGGLNVSEHHVGLASKFTVTCNNCTGPKPFKTVLYSSTKLNSVGGGNGRCFDINKRLPVAMFAIGRNYVQAKRLTANLNMPPPQSLSCWQKHAKSLHSATRKVAESSMLKAADEIGEDRNSCDGGSVEVFLLTMVLLQC